MPLPRSSSDRVAAPPGPRHGTIRVVASLVALALAGMGAAAASATEGAGGGAAQRPGLSPSWTVDDEQTFLVSPETGPTSPNRTDLRWQVHGTDLGSSFGYRGRTYFVFGDTFGAPAANPFFSVPHEDWRSNVMAFSSDSDPADGVTFDDMITDRPGHAAELLSSLKDPGVEQTVIPTYGVAVDDRMFLHYMSVREFGEPGHWTLNYSGLAYSDDGGQTWEKNSGVRWPGDSNFGQVAFVEHGAYVYLFGIPGGRYGGIQMARVPAGSMLDQSAYRYLDGTTWVTDPGAATTVMAGPVGELSVRWSSYYRAWMMMYLVDDKGLVVIRSAPELTGPWSTPRTVVTSAAYPALYAPYLLPRWNSGPDIYFTMSQFGPYNMSLMHTRLAN
jgi:hypothetical protein